VAEPVDKAEANYRAKNYDQVRFCKSCRFVIIEDSGCDRVYGRVRWGAVCDLWQLGNPKASTPPRQLPKSQNDAI